MAKKPKRPSRPGETESPSGAHYIAPDGRLMRVDVDEHEENGAGSVDDTDPTIPGSRLARVSDGTSPWVKTLLIPVIASAVTAFVAAGGAIHIGTGHAADEVVLTREEVQAWNQQLEDLKTEMAGLRAQVANAKAAQDDDSQRVRALESKLIEVATTLKIHMREDPP